MKLSEAVTVSGRFLRSVRIDQDNCSTALDGYIFSSSIREIITNFAKQQFETKQGAFTWTGPYGSGKSSLALALTALLSGTKSQRKAAAAKTEPSFAKELWSKMPPKKNGWHCVSTIGRRDDPVLVIAEGLKQAGHATRSKLDTAKKVIDTLLKVALSDEESTGGLILYLDEMGKYLESAALSNGDAYFFQLLGEAASRSNGRLVIVGILHQSFQEYASKLGRDVRDEWGKIQGRFIDVPINITADEQIELISRAIICDNVPKKTQDIAGKAVDLLKRVKPYTNDDMTSSLEGAWPLNPLVTLLLGPISRRSYGQNQRSIFSFLGSFEQSGFRDYLESTTFKNSIQLYSLSKLWDYLDFNLQSAIAVSFDSHHFTNSREALLRVAASGGSNLELDIVKSISLLELTQKHSGLGASVEALEIATGADVRDVQAAIADLEKKSIIVFKKFRDAYALFDGSDFDIETALESAYREISSVDIKSISEALSVSTVFSKRHYHQTGSLRWCELTVLFEDQIEDFLNSFSPSNGAFGALILSLGGIDGTITRDTAFTHPNADIAVAHSKQSQNLVALAREHEALRFILLNNAELQRDKIAWREVDDRMDSLSTQIEREVWKLIDAAEWTIGKSKKKLNWTGLNALSSDLADDRFAKSPILRNELLNRTKPSGSANAALKQLLYALVLRSGKQGLGFQKYPAEKGLFVSLIGSNDLYLAKNGVWNLVPPQNPDKAKLLPLWKDTRGFLKTKKDKNVKLTDVYNFWRAAPYGVKDGLMPLLATMFMLTESKNLSHYREGIFLSKITDIDIDYILKAPHLIQLRWMKMNNTTKRLLADLANVAGELSGGTVENLSSLDVGRALISAYESSAPWVQRTARLSDHAKKVRSLFKRSNDPTKFTFDDIPTLYAEQVDVSTEEGVAQVAENVKEGLQEILNAYSLMLNSMKDQILAELQVHSRSPKAYEELNDRAQNIQNLSGDLRLKAFITQLINFDDSLESMDALAALGINKPTKNWIDNDIDKSLVQLTFFAQQFNKHEAVARIQGKRDKRSAMAMIVNVDGRPAPIIGEFNILEGEQPMVEHISTEIERTLKGCGEEISNSIILAALARVGAARIEILGKKRDIHDGKN